MILNCLCLVLEKKHSAKSSLPSVVFVTLGKEPFAAECQKIKHSAKSFFAECFLLPSVFCMKLGKELLCRVPEIKHSAKSQIPVVLVDHSKENKVVVEYGFKDPKNHRFISDLTKEHTLSFIAIV